MKKILNVLVIVLVLLFTFVACDTEQTFSNELVRANLRSSGASKALIAAVDFNINNVKVWKYTASKADNGLKTGETTEQVALDSKGQTALLSQGSWNFVLYGYDVDGNCICAGTVTNAVVTANKTTVSITVNPSQTTEGKGKIVIADDITVVNSEGVLYSLESGAYTRDVKVYAKSDSKKTNPLAYESDLSAGSYTVVVTFNGTADGNAYVAATGEKVVNVYDNLTTSVYGTISESTYATTLTNELGVVTGTASKYAQFDKSTGLNSEIITLNVASTPKGSDNVTTVSFPTGAIDLGATEVSKKTIKVSVSSSSIAIASNAGYEVTATDNKVVAALDLAITGTDITSFKQGVEVTTYIEKELDPENINIEYVGETEETEETKPSFISYDPLTGELKFTVHHFSEYIIVSSDSVVYDSKSLSSAIKAGGKVRLIDDITLTSTIKILDTKEHVINLNGHNISSSDLPFQIQKGTVEFSGKGIISTTESSKNIIEIFPNETNKLSTPAIGSIKVTIGENVTLKGGQYGILISQNSSYTNLKKLGANGAVINMKGSIENSNGGLYINGNVNLTNTYAPTINLDGATIDTTNVGIYCAGYGKWNITNTTIAADTPFSLKSGTFTIESGTFTANGEYVESLTDDSNSAILNGSVLSLTSNDSYAKTLSVTINDGTFTSTNGYAIYEGIPLKKDSADEKVATVSYVTLDIQGGSFSGNTEKGAINLTEMTNKAVIKGGTFNSNPSTYLVDSYTATENSTAGTWTVSATSV